MRICKYGFNTHLAEFDTKQNKYLETDGTLHTRERCESLKKKTDVTLEAVQKKLEFPWHNCKHREVNGAMTKWTCFICGQVVPKFSLVVSHVEKHKQEQEKANSLLNMINEDWRRENK